MPKLRQEKRIKEMSGRDIGWNISWFLSNTAYIIWLIRLPQLDCFLKTLPNTFVMTFLIILLGMIVLLGGGLLILS